MLLVHKSAAGPRLVLVRTVLLHLNLHISLEVERKSLVSEVE